MGEKYRILIVDDEPDVAIILRPFLEPEYEVVTAVNGLDALLKLPRCEPDLLIVDLMMPLMDGWELAERVREHPDYHSMPMLFLTALDSRDNIRKGYEHGANVYITKPFDPERVLKNIRVFIERENLTPQPKQYSLHVLARQEAERETRVEEPLLRPEEWPRPERMPPRRVEAAPPREETAPKPLASPPRAPEAIRRASPTVRKVGSPMPSQPEPPPIPAAREEPPLDAPSRAIAGFPSPPRILLVDDDPEVVDILRLALQRGFEVVTANDGFDALNKIPDAQPDLYVIDIMMPKMSGLQLLQLLRQSADTKTAPVIVLSAKTSKRDQEYARTLGADAYITKPFATMKLLSELENQIQRADFVVRHPKKKTLRQIHAEYEADVAYDEKRERARTFRQTDQVIDSFLKRHGDEDPFTGKPAQH